MYEYKATLLKVVDADTVDLAIDLGCFVRIDRRIRLYGVNAYELRASDPALAALGLRGRDFAKGYLPFTPNALTIRTQLDKGDKYGRLLGTIFAPGKSASLNDALVAAGFAVPYMAGE